MVNIKFVERPSEGRPRKDVPESFEDILKALLSGPIPTEWADLRELFPHLEVREAFLRRLRRRAIVATSGAGRYVRVLRLK